MAGRQVPSRPVVVLGYGSLVRGDDAVGRRVAEELARAHRHVPVIAGAHFVVADCLTPELAEDLAGSGFTVFLDAACDGRPAGDVSVKTLAPGGGESPEAPGQKVPKPVGGKGPVAPAHGGAARALGAVAGTGCWEDLTPERLVVLAEELYGAAPPAVVVSVGVESLSLGEDLSGAVEAAIPKAVAVALATIAGWAGKAAAGP